MEEPIRVRLLGAVQVERDGKPVGGFRSRKALALLGYLAVQGQPVPRERLMDLLWEDKTESRGRGNLSWVLSRISSLLPGLLQGDRHTVQFLPEVPYWLDVDAFEALEGEGTMASLASAAQLYRGEFLEGLCFEGCAEFELWVVGERERWRQRAVSVLMALAAHHGRQGAYEEGLRYAQELVALEPWREEAHRQAMRLLARSGQRSAALAQYGACRRVLAEELNVEPVEETTTLYERIRAAATMRRHNLPPRPTSFVGREEELAQIASLLDDPDCRLLTIVGPGGIGKTRLALQAAAARVESFLEGVCFVPLAAVGSVDSLVSAIADALQLSLIERRDPQAQLLDYLRRKEVLLVLDSFEHLVEGTDLLADILERAPEVKLLVTSRERLNLRWERCFEIAGLTYPRNHAANDAAGDLERYSATRLFQERAHCVRREFELSAHNRRAVIGICQTVEGMPLGIELAAAGVKTHTCEEIAQQMAHDLGFLSTSLQDVPERHRSLRAAFERSWRLLTPSERDAFMQLSVFRQGFQREAAGEVAGASPAVLESLVDKSLLRFDPTGRFEMHELLRQYVAEKLAGVPDVEAAAHDRHCAHYTAFLQRWEAHLTGAGAAEALAAIGVEMANVRSAWRWAVTRAKLEEISQGLDGLSRYYFLAGPFREGEALIGMAVDRVRAHVSKGEQAGRDGRPILGRLLAEQAYLLNLQGMHEGAIAAARAAIDHAVGSQAARAETAAYLQWGVALWWQGAYEAARSRLERALALARAAQLPLLEGDSLRDLGVVCRHLEDWAGARIRHEQALHIHRAMGYRPGESASLNNLGDICNRQGDYAGARVRYEEALRILRESGDRRGKGIVLSNLGLLCHRQGDDEAALQYSRQALHTARGTGDHATEAYALTHLGHALEGLGPLSEAAEAYRQALALRQELGEQSLAIESLAGLARVSLAQGNLAGAQAEADEILAYLEQRHSTAPGGPAPDHGLHGMVNPFQVYLTCYRVLAANGDPCAPEILATAHQLLQEQAARIGDDALRRAFLENVASHREIVEEVDRISATCDRPVSNTRDAPRA